MEFVFKLIVLFVVTMIITTIAFVLLILLGGMILHADDLFDFYWISEIPLKEAGLACIGGSFIISLYICLIDGEQ